MADVVPAEEFVELAGGRVHVLRGGAGEPVLFLHAAGGAGVWHPFHQLLAEAGFTVLAPDHPGFGKSDDFPAAEAVDDLVYHYLDVLDALGLSRPHVVGGSFGGWIAAELAVHSPHRVGSLTLLSAAGLRIPEHPVTDLFLLPPDKLVATLFHDAAAAPAPAAPRRPAGPGRDHRRLPGGDLTGPVLLGSLHVRPQAGTAARPDHRADAGGRAVRRPADPGRARAAVRGADPRRQVRRGRRLRARHVLRAAGGVRVHGGRLPECAPPARPRAESAGEVQLLPPDALPLPAGRLRREVRLVGAHLPERELLAGARQSRCTRATWTNSSTRTSSASTGWR